MADHDSTRENQDSKAFQPEDKTAVDDSNDFPVQGQGSKCPGLQKAVLMSLTLFVLVVGTFLPALRGDFVGFDDPEYVTANVHVQRGLTWENLAWAFRSNAAGNWHPLTWLSHMLDCQLFGLAPWGHHLTSILLHAFSTVLLFLVLQRMTGSTWRSFFVAAFFGLHPLRVESVVWVSERKDVLSTFFWMLTIWAYTQYARGRIGPKPDGAAEAGRDALPRVQADPQVGPTKLGPTATVLKCPGAGWYVLVLVFFALGLMSKPMLVTLPFVLLLLDYWPLGEFKSLEVRRLELQSSAPKGLANNSTTRNSQLSNFLRLVAEKLPLFLMSLAVGIVTFVVQKKSGFVTQAWPLGDRLENAMVSYCRYLGKWLCPTDLAVYYPHPDHWQPAIVGSACLLLLAISVLTLVLRRRHPWLLVGWLWYICALAPVIGLVQVGGQAMADRYSYIPSVGICLLLVWGAHELTGVWRGKGLGLAFIGSLLIVLCIALSRKQIGYWKDSEALFRHAVASTRNNVLAYDNLGTALSLKGRVDESIAQYQEALRIKPDFAEAHNNLGASLEKRGQWSDAISQFVQAIELKPDYADAHYNLGNALNDARMPRDAVAEYQEALRYKPDFSVARYNLGNTLSQLGRLDEAIARYRELLKRDPGYGEAHYNLGAALYRAGRGDEAIREYREFSRLRPDSAVARVTLGELLLKTGHLDEAIGEFQGALRLNPEDNEAQKQLDAALSLKRALERPAAQTKP